MRSDQTSNVMEALLQILEGIERTSEERTSEKVPNLTLRQMPEKLHEEAKPDWETAGVDQGGVNRFAEQIATAMMKLHVIAGK
jgi:hypothetical protein